ncbi:hypothetical protein HYX01_01380 [Candidatus Woesearchaeota archaeon]|nr:hypothetical protein [Candidatus Woesearchaeota archaeon]
MIIVVIMLVVMSKFIGNKNLNVESGSTRKAKFDVQPIKTYITECLAEVSKDGLKKIGRQGGYLFTSQGGTLVDYTQDDRDKFFIEHEGSKVVYNILKPRFDVNEYSAAVPDYPWKFFPYFPSKNDREKFEAQDIFGANMMPALKKTKAQSMQLQLETFVGNNIGNCLDFSTFEEQGFKFSKKENKTIVSINENDVVFKMEFPITVEASSGEKTELKDFLAKHNLRLAKMHDFADTLIENDISNIKFDISKGSSGDFIVEVKRDISGKDDLIIITDKKSLLDNAPYKYFFARKNRAPALHYIKDDKISMTKQMKPTYGFEYKEDPITKKITKKLVITGEEEDMQPLTINLKANEVEIRREKPVKINLDASDADEDTPIFSSASSGVSNFGCPTNDFSFKIEVGDGDDGNPKDYQIITVSMERC